MHQTIKKVTEDYETLKFNTALAQLMTLTNDFYKLDTLTEKDYKTLLVLLNPVAPHITEELWEINGFGGTVSDQSWPLYDEKALILDEIEVVVQINGKVRDKLLVPNGLANKEIETLALETDRIIDFIGDKKVIKVIVIPGKLVNIVVK